MEHILFVDFYAGLIEWIDFVEVAAHRAGSHEEIHELAKGFCIHFIDRDNNVWNPVFGV